MAILEKLLVSARTHCFLASSPFSGGIALCGQRDAMSERGASPALAISSPAELIVSQRYFSESPTNIASHERVILENGPYGPSHLSFPAVWTRDSHFGSRAKDFGRAVLWSW